MSFDLAAFKAKIDRINLVLPTLGQLIQTAQILAPNAAGLTKAGLVINTVVAAEPVLDECRDMLAASITGIVGMYRSTGTLPAPPTTAAAPTAPVTK